MTKPHLILGIGELLWDILPNATRLGGAPANFAVMAGPSRQPCHNPQPHRP